MTLARTFLIRSGICAAICLFLFANPDMQEALGPGAVWLFPVASLLLTVLYGDLIIKKLHSWSGADVLVSPRGLIVGHTVIVLCSTLASAVYALWNLAEFFRVSNRL
jgi:hypothetical protein